MAGAVAVRERPGDEAVPATKRAAVRILILKLSALGDVIHTLPALTTLRRHLPGAHLSWLVEDAAADLLAGHPALDRLVVLPRRTWSRDSRGGRRLAAVRGFLGFARAFRAERFDLAIDFQGLAKSAVWMALARSRRKAGFDRGLPRNEGAWLTLNERVPPGSPDRHALDRGLALLEGLGFARLPLVYDVPVGAEAEALADRWLREAGIEEGAAFAAVNPMTRWATKDWEPGRFAAVIDRLHARRIPVVVTGGPGDREAVDAIQAQSTSLATSSRLDGRTPLKVLAAVYRRARVVLSTDTGPMHLAAAMGTPVVALFGPTAPWRTGPYGTEHAVLRLELECSPCFRRQCETTLYEPRACMLRLSVDEVVEAVAKTFE